MHLRALAVLIATLTLGGCVVRTAGPRQERRSGYHCHDRGGKHHKQVCHSHRHGHGHR